MLYEIRTYDLEPFAVRAFMARYCEALEQRADPGRPVGAWYTDIGPLNQFVQIWAWDSLDQRAETRAANAKDPHWPPKVGEFLTGPMSAEIFVPFDFSPEVTPGTYGPYYEMRTYTLRVGGIPKIAEMWPTKLAERTAISPLLLAAHSELGGLNKMVHIWPYESLEARTAAREQAHSTGAWPPTGGSGIFARMENKIMLPAPCSPVQ
jgi:hypothetical protein